MRFRIIGATLVLASSMALAACACVDAKPAGTSADADEASETNIMVGRVEVMQDQVQRGLELVTGKTLSDQPREAGGETYRRLYNAVERYNALAKFACAERAASGNLCTDAPYLPLWYAGRARPETYAKHHKMAEEMQNTMIPLWDAVCAKAKAKSRDEHFCAIE